MLGDSGLCKSAAREIYDRDLEHTKDRKAVKRRHMLLALKRALQGALVGGIAGNIYGAGQANQRTGVDNPPDSSTIGRSTALGALSGAALGGVTGGIEGGLKRAIGVDPLLQTVATARRA